MKLNVHRWFSDAKDFPEVLSGCKRPFQMKSLTSTNAIIQLKDDSKAEELNVLRQRLLLCKAEMSSSILWVEHSGRLRKRKWVWCNRNTKNLKVIDQNNSKNIKATKQDNNLKFSRCGCPIKKPARFLHVSNPENHSQKEGEVVRLKETWSRETDHVHNMLRKMNMDS